MDPNFPKLPAISSALDGPDALRKQSNALNEQQVGFRLSWAPVERTAGPSTALTRISGFAPVGGCDFFYLPHSLWPESLEEHLPTSIAGVLRLRAINHLIWDRSARRFAQSL